MNSIKALSNFHNSKSTQSSNKHQNIPKPYLDIAQGMETQFVNNLINEMHKSVDAQKDNSATKYYKSLMNHERAKIMASVDNGIGLKDVILDQIYPQHMRNQVDKQSAVKMYKESTLDSKGDSHE